MKPLPLTAVPLTYEGVGASIDRREGERRARLGVGAARFEAAVDAVMRWEVKTRSGFEVTRIGDSGPFASGTPVTDNLNIQTAGPRGPALLQDVWLIEKLAHFAREVIPERRMHAKGSGAHGTFTVTHDITDRKSTRLNSSHSS